MKLSYNIDVKQPEKSDLAPNLSEETKAFVDFMTNADHLSMLMEFDDKKKIKKVESKLKAYAKRKSYGVAVFSDENGVYAVKC